MSLLVLCIPALAIFITGVLVGVYIRDSFTKRETYRIQYRHRNGHITERRYHR